jgi:hypothetical protein
MIKNTVFSVLLAFFAALVIRQMLPPSVDAVLTLTLSKSAGPVSQIDQPRNIAKRQTLLIDRVELHADNQFKHPTLGVLGWGEYFYADINTNFTVAKDAEYRFEVGSDDGFQLAIDGRIICEHKLDRPFQLSTCNLPLKAGAHRLALQYFQGYGNAGLTLKAGRASGKLTFWGESIKGIHYQPATAP